MSSQAQLTQIRNAAYLRLFIPADNISQLIPVQEPISIDLPPAIIDLIIKLNLLQELSGYKFSLAVNSEQDGIELHYLVNVLVSVYLTHKLSSDNINYVSFKLPRDKALELLNNYKENKVRQEEVIITSYSATMLKQKITIPNVMIILSNFHPTNDISVIEQGSESTK